MGLKPSKRQSYTPGGTEDAGLPTATVENGQIKSSGANGQVKLLSNKEMHQEDIVAADTSMTITETSISATSPSEKKKRRMPRFVFNRKRTGSGKRSRKSRQKEINGVRPMSYPAASTTAGDSATDAGDANRPYSLCLEELSISEGEAPASPNVDGQGNATDTRKTSSSSNPSPSKSQKADKKKNSSHKRKGSKNKKERDTKSKPDKKKKEDSRKSKNKEKEEDPEERIEVVEDVVDPVLTTAEEQVPSLQKEASIKDDAKTDDTALAITGDTTVTEEQVKAGIEVTETDLKLDLAGSMSDELEDETELELSARSTAEQIFAEVEHTITGAQETETQKEQFEETAQETQRTEQPDLSEVSSAEEVGTFQLHKEEKRQSVDLVIPEDILELTDITQTVQEPVHEERPQVPDARVVGDVPDEPTEAADKAEAHKAEVTEDVIVVEVQPSIEAAPQEAVSEEVQQQVESLVESSPVTTVAEESTRNDVEERVETPTPPKLLEETNGAAGDDTQAAKQIIENPEIPELPGYVAYRGAVKPTEEPAQVQAMTPAQLKALEKEQKAAKKREEKERAKREKEEKKRLKEQQKLEAKERKRKEKEEKERKQREAKEKAKALARVTIEVKPEEAAQETVEEFFNASQGVMAESAPRSNVTTDVKQEPCEEVAVVAELQSSVTRAEESGNDIQAEAPEGAPEAPLHSTTQIKAEGGLLGSSVKEIISTIENNATMEAKTYDEELPPQIPESPYPDEDDIQPSSAAIQFSSPSETSASPPASPTTPQEEKLSPGSPDSATELSVQVSPVSIDISESARSSVLRKIELGPRLRTAILRKSSSGAEKEEKRVSLTKPRHVQLSDLTPPPRKPRACRPLEHSRGLSGDHGKGTTSPKEPEPVTEEQTAVVACTSESSPVEGETNNSDTTEGILREHEVNAELPAPDSQVHAEPESPTVVSVANIVLGGQTEDSELESRVDSHLGNKAAENKTEDTVAQASLNVDDQLDDVTLQKVAADVVVQVQKAAQEKAYTMDLQEKVDVTAEESADVKSDDCDSGKCDEMYFEKDCEDSDDDTKVTESESSRIFATVTCSAELISLSPDTDSCTTQSDVSNKDRVDSGITDTLKSADESDPKSSCDDAVLKGDSHTLEKGGPEEPATQDPACQGAVETTQVGTALLAEVREAASSVVDMKLKTTDKNTNIEDSQTANHDDGDAGDKTDGELSADTLQLQQFNKNYYGIAIVPEDDDDDGRPVSSENSSEEPGSLQETSDDTAASSSDNPAAPNSSENASAQLTEQLQNGSDKTENGDAGSDETKQLKKEEENDVELEVKVTRYNGSHESFVRNDHHSNDTIDAYLKLQVEVNGDKTLENNNNISGEGKTVPPVRDEETTSSTTSDSRD